MSKRIMIVDDDQNDLNSMKEILEGEGYEVICVENGADALDQLTGDGFSLIMIDIQMPTLTGYDLLRLMREKVNHDAKMIYVSIVPEKEVLMDDVDGFIQKPFSSGSLIEKVKKVIGS